MNTISEKAQKSILVVDDEKPILELLARALVREGHAVDTASDGEEALAVLRRHGQKPYDLMITDILMPNLDGEALLVQVGREFPSLRTMALTAVGNKDLVIRLLRAGITDYLDKPFTIDAFLDRVRRLLEGERLPGAMGELARLKKEMDQIIQAEVEERTRLLTTWMRGKMLHHLSQPMTVLQGSVDLLARVAAGETSVSLHEIVGCLQSATACLAEWIEIFSKAETLRSSLLSPKERTAPSERE